MTPRISRRTALIGTAVVVGVAVIVFSVVALTRGDDGPATSPPVPAQTTPSFDPSATPTPTQTSGAPRPSSSGPTETTRDGRQSVAMDEAADLGSGITASVTSIRAVKGKAQLPGEVSGPAISVVLEVTAGSKPIDFDQTVVNAYYGADDKPAVALTTGTTAFSGALAADRSASGTYVFSVPKGQLKDVVIELDFALGTRVTLFRGPVS